MILRLDKETFQDELRKRNADNIKKMQSCLHQENSNLRLALIQGPSGSGKTTLAETLRQPAEAAKGYFVTGRFDKIGVTRPFAAFVQAMQDFASAVPVSDDLFAWLQDHSINNYDTCTVLTEVIPQLKSILQCNTEEISTETTTPTGGASQRFLYAFRAFLKAVSTFMKSKLVLLLDDLHMADPGSVDLLSTLVDEDGMDRLLILVCTESVDTIAMLKEKIGQRERFIVITQKSLDEDELHGILARSVTGLDCDSVRELAHALVWLTQGNLVLISGLLEAATLGIIEGLDKLSASTLDQTITYLLTHVLAENSTKVWTAASVFGVSVDQDILSKATAQDGSSVRECLQAAERCGIVRYVRNRFEFTHPLVQEAVYRVVPTNEQERFHLKLARQLWRSFDADELDLFVYHILSQYKLGSRLITHEKETAAVASLCLVAGRKAARACSFSIAATYLKLGMDLLLEHGWTSEYDLTLSLYNAAAEMEMCNTAYDRMNQLLDATLSHAISFQDKIQAYTTRIYYLGVIDEQEKAIDLGLDILEKLGERFPRRYHMLHILREFMSVRRLVKKMSNEQLLRSPPLKDPTKLACLHILQLIYLNAMLMRPTFAPLLQLRMIRITREYGLSVFASMAYISLGMLNMAIVDDYVEGVRLGALAIELLEKFDAIEYVPRVYAFYYGIIHCWNHPIEECFAPLLDAYEIGQETGDFEFAALCAVFHCVLPVGHGMALPEVVRKWEYFQSKLVDRRQLAMLNLAVPLVKNVFSFVGLSPEPLETDEFVTIARTHQDTFLNDVQRRLTSFIRHVIFNDYDQACHYRLSKRELKMIPPSFIQFEMLYFSALVYTAMVRRHRRHRGLIRKARAELKQMTRMLLLMPHNALSRCHLIEAEIAAVCGEESRAVTEYVCSITLSKPEGMFMYGMTNECAARHFLSKGDVYRAKQYFADACQGFERWGAIAKVEQLKGEIARMAD